MADIKAPVTGIRIAPLEASMNGEAVGVLARAFMDNPIHATAFGPGRVDRNEVMFRIALGVLKGRTRVALEGTRILGVVHWVAWPDCQFSMLEKLRMMPGMMQGFGPRLALRVSKWLAVWEKHDPREPHVHLGPIAVAPSAQGRGIGQQLMTLYCVELDQTAQAGYLETDSQKNVDFYRRFGFEVTAEVPALGTPTFLMWRKAAG